MRKIRIDATEPVIIFEGTQYPAGVWLVTNGFVAEEPGHYVYHEEEERIEVEAAGVMSIYTADRLLHNWPDTVSEVELPKEPPKELPKEPLITTGEGWDEPAKPPKRRSKAKAKAGK